VRGEQNRSGPAQLGELGVEQLRTGGVERGERLVEHEQLWLVQEHATQSEPLCHPARVRRNAVVPHVPQAETLEQHPGTLAPLQDVVEPAVQLEVLERGQLAVDEWLVREEADRGARHVHVELALARKHETGAQTEQCRLAGAVRAGDDRERSVLDVEVDAAEDALVTEALAQLPGPDHSG